MSAILVAGAVAVLPAAPASASAPACAAVDVVFARGTGEPAGLGIVGGQTAAALASDLPDRSVSSDAVDYPAALTQLSTVQGAQDLTAHVTGTAARCPGTTFVLGGYSQGADALDLAIGVFPPLGLGQALPLGTTIPDSLAPRVSAVVAFANPYGATGGSIEKDSAAYGAKAKSFCDKGDPVCTTALVLGPGLLPDPSAHVEYRTDGSAAVAAAFAAAKVRAG